MAFSEKEPQLVDTLLGSGNLVAVVPAAFHLADFTTDNFVAGLGIAGDIDPAHINPLARIDKNCESDLGRFSLSISGEALTLAKA
jgi:hypothetical protein